MYCRLCTQCTTVIEFDWLINGYAAAAAHFICIFGIRLQTLFCSIHAYSNKFSTKERKTGKNSEKLIMKLNLPIRKSTAGVVVIVVVVWIWATIFRRTNVPLLKLTMRLTACTVILCASIFVDFICIQSI